MYALGYSYDVFGQYATPFSMLNSLFEWEKAKTKSAWVGSEFVVPVEVTATPYEQNTVTTMEGTSIEEFESNLNIHTKLEGNYSYFSGSLSTNYDLRELRNAKNEFTHIQHNIAKWSLQFNVEDARDLLYPQVKEDLDTLPAEALFTKYGTHVLTGILIGGRATYYTATNQVTYESGLDLEFVADLSYKQLTNQLSAEEKTAYSETINSFQSNTSSELYTIGGLAELGGNNIINTEVGYKEWSESVGAYPTFVDFLDASHRPLTPIWELCTEDSRKEALKNAYSTFAANKTKEDAYTSDSITSVNVISGDVSEIEAPTGWVKYPFDLNAGAGGRFIYVIYKTSTAKEIADQNLTPIVGLDVIKGEHTEPPPGYQKIDQDLNQGAHGAFIYLCYKDGIAGDPKQDDIVKGIMVIGKSNAQVYPPDGFIRIDQDCNAGAGGLYIYICYSNIF